MQHFIKYILSTFDRFDNIIALYKRYLLLFIWAILITSTHGCSVPYSNLTTFYSHKENLNISANNLSYTIVSYQLRDTTTLFNNSGIIPVFKIRVVYKESGKIDNYVFNYQVYSSRIAGAMTKDVKKYRQSVLINSSQNSDTSLHDVSYIWSVPQVNSGNSQSSIAPIRTSYWSIDSVGKDLQHELEVYNVLSIPNNYPAPKQSFIEYPDKENHQKAYTELLLLLEKRLR